LDAALLQQLSQPSTRTTDEPGHGSQRALAPRLLAGGDSGDDSGDDAGAPSSGAAARARFLRLAQLAERQLERFDIRTDVPRAPNVAGRWRVLKHGGGSGGGAGLSLTAQAIAAERAGRRPRQEVGRGRLAWEELTAAAGPGRVDRPRHHAIGSGAAAAIALRSGPCCAFRDTHA
jgi:hypothetical protein